MIYIEAENYLWFRIRCNVLNLVGRAKSKHQAVKADMAIIKLLETKGTV